MCSFRDFRMNKLQNLHIVNSISGVSKNAEANFKHFIRIKQTQMEANIFSQGLKYFKYQ